MSNAVPPIPPGFHSLTPHLVVDGAAEYIDFLKRAFNAQEMHRSPGPGGKLMHVTVKIGDSMLMFADDFSTEFGMPPVVRGNLPLVMSYYVEDAKKAGTLKSIAALILVDMIGDRDLHILKEENSTPWLTQLVWGTAGKLGRREFESRTTPIEDDHLEFLAAGVPSVDIIDLDYPAWHRADDTMDKVSAKSLQAVGDVVMAALKEIAAK